MSRKQMYHLLQVNSGAMYWIKVRSTQFDHLWASQLDPFFSTYYWHLNGTLDILMPKSEGIPLGVWDKGKMYYRPEAGSFSITRKIWKMLACTWLYVVWILFLWLTSLESFLSYGANVVYKAYGVQDFHINQ